MATLFPHQKTLHAIFSNSSPWAPRKVQSEPVSRSKYLARSELYPAWSAVDDAKNKAAQLSDAAVREFEKSSSKVQAKTGNIEMYSMKYYAACTFGGLLACVSKFQ
jgi:solute carrier family 25 (mitochondrial phosphate transporter), member 3